MTDLHLYTKLSRLPLSLKTEVSDFVDFLIYKAKEKRLNKYKRIPGKAKGLLQMKENFDDPISGFQEYIK